MSQSPSATSPRPLYTYVPLPSKTHIRLIRLNDLEKEQSFTLTVHDLASPSTLPPFTALSYTWGFPYLNQNSTADSDSKWNKPTDQFGCNGCTFLVRPNLSNALMMLHLAEGQREELVWIDAICIDQGNIAEREDQVMMMGEIFERAEGILAWLGTSDEFTDDALKVIQNLTKVGKVCTGEEEMELERQKYDWVTAADLLEPEAYEKLGIEFITLKEWRAWFGFVSRPYFRRAWIVQEVLKARKLDMCIHDVIITWRHFSKAVHFLEQVWAWGGSQIINKVIADIFNPETKAENSVDTWNLASFLLRIGARRHVALVVGGTRSQDRAGLDVLLQDHRDTQATDPRDKVYAFIGLTSDPLGDLKVDYESPVEVIYTRTARHLCRLHEDLRIFGHREPNRNLKNNNPPSWVPEFSAKHDGGAMKAGAGGGNDWMASGGETWKPDNGLLEDRELQVRGRLLGVVHTICSSLLFRGAMDERWQGWRNLLRLLHATSCASKIQGHGHSPDATISPLENLARTLTRDTFRGISPAPSAELANQFLNYLIDQYLHSYGKLEQTPESARIWNTRQMQIIYTDAAHLNDSSSIGDLLSVLTDHELEGSHVRWDTFNSRLDKAILYGTRVNGVYFGEQRQPATVEKILELELREHAFKDFEAQAEASLNNRTIYSVACGDMVQVVLGPADGTRGDEVWVLDGVETPVVLRKMAEVRYEFVGEAYLHGMMHGEALERFPDVEDIVLV
ncbi:Heterokaryon incompatibility protein (HET) domain containing protein [Rhypophila decipiens]